MDIKNKQDVLDNLYHQLLHKATLLELRTQGPTTANLADVCHDLMISYQRVCSRLDELEQEVNASGNTE